MSYYESVIGDLEAFNVVGTQQIIPSGSPITSYTWSNLDPTRTHKLKYHICMNTGSSVQNIHLIINGDTGANYWSSAGGETSINMVYSVGVSPTCVMEGEILIRPSLIKGTNMWRGEGVYIEGARYEGRHTCEGYYPGTNPMTTLLLGSSGSKTFYGSFKLLVEAETI